ncbi:MAG: DUF1449 family protein [Pseudoprimorskyibacter sp.]|nr:DUF1449 family protein [Pseudoprimorskyibacter sp.]
MSGLLGPSLFPFTVALGLFGGLFLLELIALLLGGTMIFAESDADIDLDAPDMSGFGAIDIDGPDLTGIDISDFDLADAKTGLDLISVGADPAGQGGLGLLGLGHVPFVIWLGAALSSFGVTGILLQATGPWPVWLVAPLAAVVSFGVTGRFARLLGRLLPQTQTSAVTIRQLGSRRGIVTQGVARRDQPAEVRVRDGYGNTHHLRAEPHKDGDVIPAGTDVLVLYHRPTKRHRLVAISDS